MSFNVSRKDIIWGYFAQFFTIASGILVLPFVLRLLDSNEIALYYLMLNVGALVVLFDFGFSSQFTRIFSYIFAGAQHLKAEGYEKHDNDCANINYRLLKTVIQSARLVYTLISFIVLFVLLTLGTLYMSKTTNGFSLVENSFVIWILYSLSVFFNMYYSYLNSLLYGSGNIAGSRKAMVFSKLVYIIISIILLYLGLNLISIVIANLVAPFVQRTLSYNFIYTGNLKSELRKHHISKSETIHQFWNVWYNAKRMGMVMLGAFAINRSGMLFAGIFLSLDQVASYGLMQQLVGVISSVSTTMFAIHQPSYASYLVQNRKSDLMNEFSLSMGIFYLLFLLFTLLLVTSGPAILNIIGSKSLLPMPFVLIVFCIISFLEQNHSLFAGLISLSNTIPYVIPSLIAGLAIIIGTYLALAFFNFGIWGLVIVPGIVQLAYANWKWPLFILKEYNISIRGYLSLCSKEAFEYIKAVFNGIYRLLKKQK